MSESRKLMTKAEIVGEFESLASMTAYLLYSAGDVMRSGDIPNESVRRGLDELTAMVNRRMATAVEAITDLHPGEGR